MQSQSKRMRASPHIETTPKRQLTRCFQFLDKPLYGDTPVHNYITYSTKERVRGRWLEIYEAFVPDLKPAIQRLGKHTACPIHGGTDGFRLFKDAPETGGCICNTCGAFSNGFSFLEHIFGWPFKVACEKIDSFLNNGIKDALTPKFKTSRPSKYKPANAQEARQLKLQSLYAKSIPIHHFSDAPIVYSYLKGRGIHLQKVPSNLRYSTNTAYYEDGQLIGHFPTLTSLIKDINGNTTGIHLTYLDSKSFSKAPVANPKKCHSLNAGSTKGCSIQLHKASSTALAVSEGIETALAFYAQEQIPTWSCINAYGLETVIIPDHITELYVLVDKDVSEAGIKAAQVLESRYQHIKVNLLVPPYDIPAGKKSLDWADVLGGNL